MTASAISSGALDQLSKMEIEPRNYILHKSVNFRKYYAMFPRIFHVALLLRYEVRTEVKPPER
jgi:hypothetical protein